MSFGKHGNERMQIGERLGLPSIQDVPECVLTILALEDIRDPEALAAEFLFGCQYEDFPHDSELWPIFDSLYRDKNFPLLMSIVENHFWASRPPNGGEVAFTIYEGENIFLTGKAQEQVLKALASIREAYK